MFEFIEHYEYHICIRVASLILEIATIILFSHHAYKTYEWRYGASGAQAQRTPSKSMSGIAVKTAKWKLISHIATFCTLLCFVIMGGSYTLNVFSVYGPNHCDAVEIFSVLSYHTSKFLLYVVLVARIEVAFADSSYYATIQKIVYFLYSMLIAFFVFYTIGDAFFIGGDVLYTSEDTFYCLLRPLPGWGVIAFLAIDIVVSFTCCAVFIYPLKQLLKRVTKATNQKNYVELIRKYAILTTTAIVSTFIFVFINTVFRMGIWIVFDNVVNTLCILLMSSWYNTVFKRLFCCCTCCIKDVDAMKISSKSVDVTQTHSLQTSVQIVASGRAQTVEETHMSEDVETNDDTDAIVR